MINDIKKGSSASTDNILRIVENGVSNYEITNDYGTPSENTNWLLLGDSGENPRGRTNNHRFETINVSKYSTLYIYHIRSHMFINNGVPNNNNYVNRVNTSISVNGTVLASGSGYGGGVISYDITDIDEINIVIACVTSSSYVSGYGEAITSIYCK